MFLDLFEALRAQGIHCTTHEWLALMDALQRGVVGASFSSFYWTARALLVKREADFDRFDQAFLQVFAGIEGASADLVDKVLDWLKDPKALPALNAEMMAALQRHDLEALRRLFEERLKEQTERHDGGNRWVGTGGTSPFGHGGQNPAGVRVGGPGGGRSAVQIATARRFQNYRDDLVLDVRQTQIALRRLRRLVRRGLQEELDLDETIDRTGKNAGELEIVMRPPRRNQVRLTLLMDSGGSMDPFARLVSTLFSAASKSSHWRSFDAYYFHNCVYEQVWTDIRHRQTHPTADLLKAVREGSVLICVGDATMAPSELTERWGSIDYWHQNETTGVEWLWRLQRAFKRAVWLNPMPERWWGAPSCRLVERVFPMFPLTLQGIDSAIKELRRTL